LNFGGMSGEGAVYSTGRNGSRGVRITQNRHLQSAVSGEWLWSAPREVAKGTDAAPRPPRRHAQAAGWRPLAVRAWLQFAEALIGRLPQRRALAADAVISLLAGEEARPTRHARRCQWPVAGGCDWNGYIGRIADVRRLLVDTARIVVNLFASRVPFTRPAARPCAGLRKPAPARPDKSGRRSPPQRSRRQTNKRSRRRRPRPRGSAPPAPCHWRG
jgi:hypothetical protein